MSQVTSLIITSSIIEDEDYLIEKFKEFKVNGTSFSLVSVDDVRLPKGWYGGSKMIESLVFVGAYNKLNVQSLCLFMQDNIDWKSPESIQLMVKEPHDIKFRIVEFLLS